MSLLFSSVMKCRLPGNKVRRMDDWRRLSPDKEYNFFIEEEEYSDSILIGYPHTHSIIWD